MTWKLAARSNSLLIAFAVAVAACGSSASTTKPAANDTTSTSAAKSTTTQSIATSSTMAGMDHHAGNGTPTVNHHHIDSPITYEQLSPETKAQVDVVIKWAKKYKTGADAAKDGWTQATKSLYGIGAHWLHGGVTGFVGMKGGVDITQPNVLLFDGEGPTAKLAGVSWIVGSNTDPEGFAGPDDHWHRHSSVCFQTSTMLVISEGDAEGSPINLSAEGCKRNHGLLFPISNLTMMHLWIGDGYLGKAPLFAHDHPLLLNGYRPNEHPTA